MKKVFFIMLFGFMIIPAYADDRSELKKLIKDLSMDSYNEHKKNCPNLFPSPEELVEKTPDYFHGYDTNSSAWPSIREMYRNYTKIKCSYLNVEEESEYRAQHIVDAFTDDEVKYVYDYYQSGVGKKLYIVERNVTNEQTQALSVKMAEQSLRGDAYLNNEFGQILKKFPVKNQGSVDLKQ